VGHQDWIYYCLENELITLETCLETWLMPTSAHDWLKMVYFEAYLERLKKK